MFLIQSIIGLFMLRLILTISDYTLELPNSSKNYKKLQTWSFQPHQAVLIAAHASSLSRLASNAARVTKCVWSYFQCKRRHIWEHWLRQDAGSTAWAETVSVSEVHAPLNLPLRKSLTHTHTHCIHTHTKGASFARKGAALASCPSILRWWLQSKLWICF